VFSAHIPIALTGGREMGVLPRIYWLIASMVLRALTIIYDDDDNEYDVIYDCSYSNCYYR
jgi:hypothetical protein